MARRRRRRLTRGRGADYCPTPVIANRRIPSRPKHWLTFAVQMLVLISWTRSLAVFLLTTALMHFVDAAADVYFQN